MCTINARGILQGVAARAWCRIEILARVCFSVFDENSGAVGGAPPEVGVRAFNVYHLMNARSIIRQSLEDPATDPPSEDAWRDLQPDARYKFSTLNFAGWKYPAAKVRNHQLPTHDIV